MRALDLVRARRALGLPAQAVPPRPTPGARPTPAERQLAFGIGVAAPALQPARHEAPLLDLGSASAAVTVADGRALLTLVATDEDFAAISRRLRAQGYRSGAGGVLVDADAEFRFVAQVDGGVALATSRALIGARAGPGPRAGGAAAAALLLGEPLVVAARLKGCAGAVALGDALKPPRGRLAAVGVAGDPGAVVLGTPRGLAPHDPRALTVRRARQARGGVLATFTYRLGERSASPVAALTSGVPAEAVYACG